jgi:hypothetical protein
MDAGFRRCDEAFRNAEEFRARDTGAMPSIFPAAFIIKPEGRVPSGQVKRHSQKLGRGRCPGRRRPAPQPASLHGSRYSAAARTGCRNFGM